MRLPILVKYNTRILGLSGSVRISGGGRLLIGFGQISEFDTARERSIIKFNGEIFIESPCWFGVGCRIISERKGRLDIGKNFENTAKLTISNRGHIVIGQDCLVSWNTWICDTDFHKISDSDSGYNSDPNGYTSIGNHVWIGANSSVIKNASVPSGCIIATGSIVSKKFSEQSCLLAGVPAVQKKSNIVWNK